MKRAYWLTVAAWLTGLPCASAFVFVPERGGAASRAQFAGARTAQAAIRGDSDGYVAMTTANRVELWSARGGTRVWTWSPPAGTQIADPTLVSSGRVLVTCRGAAGQPADLVALAATTGPPQVCWQKTLADLPPGGIGLPLPAAPDGDPVGLVAICAGGTLQLLNIGDGTARTSLTTGRLLCPPAWYQDRAFLATDQGLVVLRITEARIEPLGPPSALPPGLRLVRAQCDLGGRLSLRSADGLVLSPFVIVPPRTQAGFYAMGNGQVSALSEGGTATWRFAAPAGWQLDPTCHDAGEVLVVSLRQADGRTRLLGLDAANGQQRWTHDADGVPADGLYSWRPPATSRRPAVLAVLGTQAVELLAPVTGQVLGRRETGHVAGPPLWVQDSLFVATSDGYQGTPAVVGVDLPAAATPGDKPINWVWRIPAGEQLRQLHWLPEAQALVAACAQSAYLFY